MKYLIITSLYTSIIVVTTTQSELLPILFSTAGILLLYWLLSHSLAMRKEIAFLKEENQYFMDSFRNIRTPITLLHTPLKSTYSNNCPDIIKKDLSLAIRNIDCLNDHLTRLMDLKQIATHSKSPCIGSKKQYAQAMTTLKKRGYNQVRGMLFLNRRHEILNEDDVEKVYDAVLHFLEQHSKRDD